MLKGSLQVSTCQGIQAFPWEAITRRHILGCSSCDWVVPARSSRQSMSPKGRQLPLAYADPGKDCSSTARGEYGWYVAVRNFVWGVPDRPPAKACLHVAVLIKACNMTPQGSSAGGSTFVVARF